MNTPEYFMRRCLQLARLGEGRTAPNPLVGCVLVRNGQIIGEGFHHGFGQPHAEAAAIRSVQDKSLLPDATLYVNLEPCAHHGKTPPCTDLILSHHIPEVHIGCRDPFEAVNGRGMEKLAAGGVRVVTPVLEKECREVNKRFLTFHERKRPYILLKWARSLDGFMGLPAKRAAISDSVSNHWVHQIRSEESAIMTGTETVLTDNPQLTVRRWFGRNPVRVIPDRNLRIPPAMQVFSGEPPVLVFNEKRRGEEENVEYIKINFQEDMLQQLLDELHGRKILSLMVEGGSRLLQSFLNENCWDEAIEITGNLHLKLGIRAPVMQADPVCSFSLGNDRVHLYRN